MKMSVLYGWDWCLLHCIFAAWVHIMTAEWCVQHNVSYKVSLFYKGTSMGNYGKRILLICHICFFCLLFVSIWLNFLFFMRKFVHLTGISMSHYFRCLLRFTLFAPHGWSNFKKLYILLLVLQRVASFWCSGSTVQDTAPSLNRNMLRKVHGDELTMHLCMCQRKDILINLDVKVQLRVINAFLV